MKRINHSANKLNIPEIKAVLPKNDGLTAGISPLSFIDPIMKDVDPYMLVAYAEEIRNNSETRWGNINLDELHPSSSKTIKLSMARLHSGYRQGIIDFGHTAIASTFEGWINENGEPVLHRLAKLNDIQKWAESRGVEWVPHITQSQLAQAEQEGILMHEGKILARRNDDSRWQHTLGRTSTTGNVERALCHSDHVLSIGESSVPFELCFGQLLTQQAFDKHGETMEKTLWPETVLCGQREAIQSQANIDSSVGIESVKDARTAEHIALMHRVTMSKDANIYDAREQCSVQPLDVDTCPSPALFRLLHRIDKLSPEVRLKQVISKTQMAQSPFEIHMAVREFCQSLTTPKLTVAAVFASMGFDAVSSSPADPKFMASIDKLVMDLTKGKGIHHQTLVDNGLSVASVIDHLACYIQQVKFSSIPTMDVGHVTVARSGQNMVMNKSTVKLPTNLKDGLTHPIYISDAEQVSHFTDDEIRLMQKPSKNRSYSTELNK
ncbi:hypothetical protein AB6D11_00535 [Vibrio splendidus]